MKDLKIKTPEITKIDFRVQSVNKGDIQYYL
jgi:hypothetical protein